jgi:DNA-directed RNA polymerase specialized sigma24 family protein
VQQDPSRYDFGSTRWSLVLEGQQSGAVGDRARNQLLERYHGAVNRYLLARLGDPHAVDEVYGIYVERVKENHPFLQRADQEKGRFRHYLRRVLQNLVVDYYRKTGKGGPRPITAHADDVFVAPSWTEEQEEQFRREWVTELMHHSWQALEAVSKDNDKPYYEVMFYKAQNLPARSRDIAQHFTQSWNKPISEANVRQILHRGQALLSDLFLEEVARSLEKRLESPASADQVEEELVELKMLDDPRRAALGRLRAREQKSSGPQAGD